MWLVTHPANALPSHAHLQNPTPTPGRRLANAYLSKYFNEQLLDGCQLFPGFMTPPPTMTQAQVRSVWGVRAAARWCLLVGDAARTPTTPSRSPSVPLSYVPQLLTSILPTYNNSPHTPIPTPTPQPPPLIQVLEYIQDTMPPESAVAFGLHPNAEIGFKLREAETFCGSLLLMQVGGRGWVGVGASWLAVRRGGWRPAQLRWRSCWHCMMWLMPELAPARSAPAAARGGRRGPDVRGGAGQAGPGRRDGQATRGGWLFSAHPSDRRGWELL